MNPQQCNEYQYEDKEESASPTPTNNSSNPQAQNLPQYEDEATEMLAKILNMSNANETSNTARSLNTEDNSDSDISYWSEDERTVLRAFYENEREDVNEQNDGSDDMLLEKYIMDLCQNANNTTKTPPSPPPPRPPPHSRPSSSSSFT